MPAFTLSRRHALLVVACAFAAVWFASRFFAPQQPAAQPAVSFPAPTTEAPAIAMPAAAPLLVVDVEGAVRRPGLYRLPQGSRVADAIARAGGTTQRADAALVNLAAPLGDGQQVLVPARVRAGPGVAPGAPGPAPTAGAAPPGTPVSLNSASVEQLDALPGVGPVTAQNIISYRQEHGPFTSVDQLDAIPGIGPTRIENLRDVVVP
jgi:competence protein ComEA